MRSFRKFRAYDVGDSRFHTTGEALIPYGWEKAGTLLDPIAYPLAFAHWGTLHGGDGVSTFAAGPDMRGRIPVGKDEGAGRVAAAWANQDGGTGGEEKHTLQAAENGPHNHGVYGGSTDTSRVYGYFDGGQSAGVGGSTSTVGSGTAHNVRQPGAAGFWIVRVL